MFGVKQSYLQDPGVFYYSEMTSWRSPAYTGRSMQTQPAGRREASQQNGSTADCTVAHGKCGSHRLQLSRHARTLFKTELQVKQTLLTGCLEDFLRRKETDNPGNRPPRGKEKPFTLKQHRPGTVLRSIMLTSNNVWSFITC